ncbi:MAG: hypothetical protein H0T62_06760 [Parachlamydiaceae bacterium]|nr:hypothetical protein [Parachlamydiaceae bacterium]
MINTKDYIEKYLRDPYIAQANEIIPACKQLIDFADKEEVNPSSPASVRKFADS